METSLVIATGEFFGNVNFTAALERRILHAGPDRKSSHDLQCANRTEQQFKDTDAR